MPKHINGTNGADSISGTGGNDLINALGGEDTVLGGSGDDLIYGGDGFDYIGGGTGSDTIFGGAGRDHIYDDQSGYDSLIGEDGDDVIDIIRHDGAPRGGGWMDGGAGNDRLGFSLAQGSTDYDESVAMYGGDGDDILRAADGVSAAAYGGADDDKIIISNMQSVLVSGDEGNDYIDVEIGREGSVDAGAGDDRVRMLASGGQVTANLGSGVNQLWLGDKGFRNVDLTLEGGDNTITPGATGRHAFISKLDVSGFMTGNGGDVVDLKAYLETTTPDWSPDTDPFAGGFLHLVQGAAGATLLQYDRDGSASHFSAITWISFANTDVSDFTSANFSVFDPQATKLDLTV